MADGISVNINSDDLKKLAGEAILRSIDQEKRDLLIKQAIEHLLAGPKDSYGRATASPLERAFRDAVEAVAQKIVTEELQKDDGVRETVRKLMTDAWAKMTGPEGYQNLVDRATAALSKAFVPDRY